MYIILFSSLNIPKSKSLRHHWKLTSQSTLRLCILSNVFFRDVFFFTHVLELSCPDAAKGISDGPKPTAAQGSGMFVDVQWISSCEVSQVHDVISGNPLRRALKIRESSESGCAD